jgi:hypothetical protein
MEITQLLERQRVEVRSPGPIDITVLLKAYRILRVSAQHGYRSIELLLKAWPASRDRPAARAMKDLIRHPHHPFNAAPAVVKPQNTSAQDPLSSHSASRFESTRVSGVL